MSNNHKLDYKFIYKFKKKNNNLMSRYLLDQKICKA